MRSGTIAALVGVLLFQQLPDLPPAWLVFAVAALPWLLRRGRFRHFMTIAAAAGAGFAWSYVHAVTLLAAPFPTELEGKDVAVEGLIAGLPQTETERTRFDLLVDRVRHGDRQFETPARLRLNWYGPAPELHPGERWQFTVRLKRPRGLSNPGGFDYERHLLQQRVRATGYVRAGGVNRRLEEAPTWHLDRIRQRMAAQVAASAGEGAGAVLLPALTVGDRQRLAADHWAVLTATGTNHLVAISGLHIGLMAGLAFAAVRRVWPRLGRLALRVPAPKAAAVAALLFALGYAALAGFSVPTQRAVVMVGAVAAALLAGRRAFSGHTLFLALGAVLVIDPLVVLSPGFWLSFLAVAALLYGLGGRWRPEGLWWRYGRVHWVAAVALFPVVAGFFGTGSVSSPLANLVAVPWIGLVVVPLALAGAGLLLLWPAVGAAVIGVAAAAADGAWWLLERIAAAAAPWQGGAVSGFAVVLAAAGALLWLAPRGWPGRLVGTALWLPLLFALPAGPAPGRALVTVLDVGQGLSVVVETASHTLLYDVGPATAGRFDAGEMAVLPFLRERGRTRIDRLVISHGDNDHSGGLAAVLRATEVARISSGGGLDLPGITVDPCAAGERWEWDGVQFAFLHPPLGAVGNDGSCVLRVEAAGESALLAGDIEADAERHLVESFPLLHADLVVVPHHGSRTSSTAPFVNAVRARYAVFSIGYRNPYRFPHPTVGARWKASGAQGLTTASLGAVRFELGSGRPPIGNRQEARRYWHWRDD